jgi:hypothetical protein
VNRPGGRARPLSDAPVARWRSSRPPSSEDEPVRRLAPAGTWRVNPPGRGDRFESGSAFTRWDSSSPLSALEDARPAPQRGLNPRDG